MQIRQIREVVRVLMPSNGGCTCVLLERATAAMRREYTWEIPTGRIPPHLRRIGSRFVVILDDPWDTEQDSVEQLRAACQIYVDEIDSE
jgi:hypothetical protein